MHTDSSEGPFSRFLTNYGFPFLMTLVVLIFAPMLYFGIKSGNEKRAFKNGIEIAALEADVRFRRPTMREIEAFHLRRGMAIAYVPIDGQKSYPIVCRSRGQWKARFFLGDNPRYPTSIFTGSSNIPHNNAVTRSCYELFGYRLKPEPEGYA